MRRLLAIAVSGLILCGCASGTPASLTPSPTRSYLHPDADVTVNEASCDSLHDLYVIVRITNHSTHVMDYDIVWNETDATGKVTGSAEGVFSLTGKQVLPDERLSLSKGKCGSGQHLGQVRAYVADGENGQPYFG